MVNPVAARHRSVLNTTTMRTADVKALVHRNGYCTAPFYLGPVAGRVRLGGPGALT
jgi:hypothetical protein